MQLVYATLKSSRDWVHFHSAPFLPNMQCLCQKIWVRSARQSMALAAAGGAVPVWGSLNYFWVGNFTLLCKEGRNLLSWDPGMRGCPVPSFPWYVSIGSTWIKANNLMWQLYPVTTWNSCNFFTIGPVFFAPRTQTYATELKKWTIVLNLT
jgi:hypothetical protein